MRLSLIAFAALAAACVDFAEVRALLDAQAANGTQAMGKRYYVISEPPERFWPDGTIRYCFDGTVSNQGVMEAWMQEAWGRWIAAGADNSFVNFRQGDATDCAPGNRANILMISQNTNSALLTSWGRSPRIEPNPQNPGDPGPSMNIDLDPNIAMGSTGGNIAHEIGHAFGMMHEHQRPDLWTSPYPDGNGPTNYFAFNCNNLRDYNSMVAITPNRAEQIQNCRLFAAARHRMSNGNMFSAVDLLPLPSDFLVSFTSPGGGRDVDMRSIMLYGSKAGGAQLGNGQRATVITLADGTEFPYNNVPSRRDVNALNAMYGRAKNYEGPVYWSKESPRLSKFNIFRKGKSGIC